MREFLLLAILLAATTAFAKTPKRSLASSLTWERSILAAEKGTECAIFRRLEIKMRQQFTDFQTQIKEGSDAERVRRAAIESCARDNNIADWDSEPSLVLVSEICPEAVGEYTLVGRRNHVNQRDADEAREQLEYVQLKLKQYCRPVSLRANRD